MEIRVISGGSNVFLTNTSHHVGVGTTAPVGKLEVKGDVPISSNAPLFEVLNSNGDTVFAVYSQGVRIYVADDPAIKASGSRSGFAVGGFSLTKALTNDYLWVTPDSVRIYVEKDGGSKSSGSRGGFAVGGFSLTKTLPDDYFNISGADSAEVINPSQARMLWYPTKEAFLAGRVLIQSVDSVGTNSIAVGNESKAIGNYSQAFGYRSRAVGMYSIALGYMSYTTASSSFAFGRNCLASGPFSFAGGYGSNSYGSSSVAIGYYCDANQNSVAIGYGALASGQNSAAFGASFATGSGSFAAGDLSEAAGEGSCSIGQENLSTGNHSITLGTYNLANGLYSTAIGYWNTTQLDNSVAIGYNNISSGNTSFALGIQTNSSGYNSYAFGDNTTASGNYSYAFGKGITASGLNTVAWALNDQSLTNVTDNNVFVIMGGNVGIGTISPQYTLDVAGSCNLNKGIVSGTALSVNDAVTISFNGSLFRWGDGGLANYFADDVGIGTTSPQRPLHVSGVNEPAARFRRSNDGTVVEFYNNLLLVGDISLAGGVTSYNAFTGSHYASVPENTKKGTLIQLTGKNSRLNAENESEIVYGTQISCEPNSPKILGAYLGKADFNGENSPALIMAVGNGEMWVVDNGEDLIPGDYLISSSVPGHAMKDAGQYEIANIVARVAEPVIWKNETMKIDNVKHKRISVFFENFTIRHNEKKINELEKRIDELEQIIKADSSK
ncbi:MAG: hypothetical protein HY738_11855 [Bacteroidia bacterium]|nr:hypothetical protein [Bacteroidia bacterium]